MRPWRPSALPASPSSDSQPLPGTPPQPIPAPPGQGWASSSWCPGRGTWPKLRKYSGDKKNMCPRPLPGRLGLCARSPGPQPRPQGGQDPATQRQRNSQRGPRSAGRDPQGTVNVCWRRELRYQQGRPDRMCASIWGSCRPGRRIERDPVTGR
uniref:Uncharacterized protein n=1 Tax=Myotis myotis TaxID=51298 RepID=A0A7J7UPC0_MYOMY|nr:hypothetical protein mMyoMyo1_008552 [Myotis myotis]